ncbi:MAG: radical SAM protein, partial [Actinomycetes bacterium]
MAYQLIVSPYPDGHLVVSPGEEGGIKLGVNKYAELRDAAPGVPVPDWLAVAARAQWGLDVTGKNIAETILVRPDTPYGYARASYELNLGCNYDCDHCYLGEKLFAGMDWPDRERLLEIMAEAGV